MGAVEQLRYPAIASLRRNVSMGRLGALFRRRVSLYVSIPIVVACGVTGYVAGTSGLHSTAASQAQLRPVPETSDAVTISQPSEPSSVTVRPGDASSIAVSEVELLTPLPLPERNEAAGETVRDAPVPVLAKEATAEQRRASPAVRAAPKLHRRHRLTRQPKSAPATAPNGLKNVPLLGPVFSLMQ